MENHMRITNIASVLCLLVICGCGEQSEDCQLSGDGYFYLVSLHAEFGKRDFRPILDATVVEMPFTGTTGLLILRDEKGEDYQFDPLPETDWKKQLDGLELGKTYHFVFSAIGSGIIGMKVFDGELLVYLGASSTFRGAALAFEEWELEGFSVKQLHESKCKPMKSEIKREGEEDLTSLITSLPVVFQYGEQSVTLYPTQEATFTTVQGEFLAHLLRSIHSLPENYEDGGYSYSFYIKRLHE